MDYSLIEDATAEAFGGRTVRAKDVYDVLIPDETDPNKCYGISCKMKNNDPATLAQGRVYVEYANADAEFLGAVKAAGFTKQKLIDQKAPANKCGKAVVEVARRWHQRTYSGHKGLRSDESVDPARSVHFVLSYRWNSAHPGLFDYDLYVYPHLIPRVGIWRYRRMSLWGFESPAMVRADEPLYTYNFNSGGHLKWYPKAASATHHFGPFTLQQAPAVRLAARAASYFPQEWPR
jgi:hypothetical protein